MTYRTVDQASAVSRNQAIPSENIQSHRRFSNFAETALPLAAVVVGIALIVGPFLATVVRSALYWDASGPALSWRNFSGLFADPRFYQAALNTIICGLSATIISSMLGLGLAWVVSRTDMPGRRWLE